MNAAVLFCGMGGACDGLAQAGIRVELAVDYWQRACVAHHRWHPEMPVVRADCREAHRLAPGLRVDMLWASPSCKPYSIANRVAGRRGTDHPEHYPLGLLVEQMQAWGARYLVIENVPGLVWSVEGVAELARFHEAVSRAGLVWTYTMLSAASCGVRQLRRRVIIVVADRLVTIPDGLEPMIDVPSFGDTGPGGGRLHTIMGSSPSQYIRRDNALALAVRCDENGRPSGKPRTATATGEGSSQQTNPHTGEQNWTGRTLAECAALQCVPMEPLQGIPRSSAHELVGNAVPPPMARVVGEALIREDRRVTWP